MFSVKKNTRETINEIILENNPLKTIKAGSSRVYKVGCKL